jgi:hypothetical protein
MSPHAEEPRPGGFQFDDSARALLGIYEIDEATAAEYSERFDIDDVCSLAINEIAAATAAQYDDRFSADEIVQLAEYDLDPENVARFDIRFDACDILALSTFDLRQDDSEGMPDANLYPSRFTGSEVVRIAQAHQVHLEWGEVGWGSELAAGYPSHHSADQIVRSLHLGVPPWRFDARSRYPPHLTPEDIDVLCLARVSPEIAAAQPRSLSGYEIASLVLRPGDDDDAQGLAMVFAWTVVYPDEIAIEDIVALAEGGVTPEEVARYPQRFSGAVIAALAYCNISAERAALIDRRLASGHLLQLHYGLWGHPEAAERELLVSPPYPDRLDGDEIVRILHSDRGVRQRDFRFSALSPTELMAAYPAHWDGAHIVEAIRAHLHPSAIDRSEYPAHLSGAEIADSPFAAEISPQTPGWFPPEPLELLEALVFDVSDDPEVRAYLASHDIDLADALRAFCEQYVGVPRPQFGPVLADEAIRLWDGRMAIALAEIVPLGPVVYLYALLVFDGPTLTDVVTAEWHQWARTSYLCRFCGGGRSDYVQGADWHAREQFVTGALRLLGVAGDSGEPPPDARSSSAEPAGWSDEFAATVAAIRRFERDNGVAPQLLAGRLAKRVRLRGARHAILLTDIATEGPVGYEHVLVVFEGPDVVRIITAETLPDLHDRCFLCVFADGLHHNYDAERDWRDRRVFLKAARRLATASR